MLTVHHLRRSQSERVVWLCEELGLSYELKCYDRNKTDLLAPPSYKVLHPMGIAPVIKDGDVILGESGAIVEYLLAKHGPSGLARGPQEPDFASYLYWLHFANGTSQPVMGCNMIVRRIDLPTDHPVAASMRPGPRASAHRRRHAVRRCGALPGGGGAPGQPGQAREEMDAVVAIVRSLLQPGTTWTNAEGRTRPLEPNDILVVAPYNAQVSALKRVVRVGTVDKSRARKRRW